MTVHAGEYREWVTPRRGGLSDTRRITYGAGEGEHVVIKGSERITGWEPARRHGMAGRPFRNALFGAFNPFAEEVVGDWVVGPSEDRPRKHLGDVYLERPELLRGGQPHRGGRPAAAQPRSPTTGPASDQIRDPDADAHWSGMRRGRRATRQRIWANFQGADPNAELVEINVRRRCSTRRRRTWTYITVRGFELAQAATPVGAADRRPAGPDRPELGQGLDHRGQRHPRRQVRRRSPSARRRPPAEQLPTRGDKPGYQYQLESVFSARQIGWDKEHIGSHVIRRNTIHDCGQNAIAGHLGCVFSTIEDNHIHRIAVKREFYGHEIAGIKLHAAIDVEIIGTTGSMPARSASGSTGRPREPGVARNLLYGNSRDLFVEVSHGPYVVDHNIFASPASIELFSQGGAYVNNLICGTVGLTR